MASESRILTTEDLQHDVTVGTIKCTAPIPFGGGEQWLYLPATKKFDLSRGSQPKMVFDCEEADRNHSGFMIDPGTSVLVIVDMQNYFINPLYRDHAAGIAAIEPTIKAIERCRKEGIQVAWLNWGLTDHDLKTMAPAIQRGFSKTLGWHVGVGAQLPDRQGRCLFKRTWNADLYEPIKAVVEPGDLFFDKTRMSGLWSTKEPIHQYLRATGKQTLLFAGVNTDQCVFGTVSDAYSYGWDCILLSDCTGTMTGRGAQELTEYQISQNMGFVTDSSTLCAAQMLFIDDFLPSLTVSVTWPRAHAKLGNTINPERLQEEPVITLHHDTSSVRSEMKYTITLSDPDAPSRDDARWSEMCHWIATHVSLSSPQYPRTFPWPATLSLDEVMPYKPPGPPPKTGKHRYVFLVFAPKNGTSEALRLEKPGERRHWGFGEEGKGVREWARSMGLMVVGAEFVYAKNEEQ
ncbi:hypothetical protein ACEQ8H_005821 [Pleosporales sp. CAS-2024a]